MWFKKYNFKFGIYCSDDYFEGGIETTDLFLIYKEDVYTVSTVETREMEVDTFISTNNIYKSANMEFVDITLDNWEDIAVQAIVNEYNLPISLVNFAIKTLELKPHEMKFLVGTFETPFKMTQDEVYKAMEDLKMYEALYSGSYIQNPTSGNLSKYIFNISKGSINRQIALLFDERIEVLEFIEDYQVAHFNYENSMIQDRKFPVNDINEYNNFLSKYLGNYSSVDSQYTGYILKNQDVFSLFIQECITFSERIGIQNVKPSIETYRGTYHYNAIVKVYKDILGYIQKTDTSTLTQMDIDLASPIVKIKSKSFVYLNKSPIVNVGSKGNKIIIEEIEKVSVWENGLMETRNNKGIYCVNDASYIYMEGKLLFNGDVIGQIKPLGKFYVYNQTIIYMVDMEIFVNTGSDEVYIGSGLDFFCTSQNIFIRVGALTYKYDMKGNPQGEYTKAVAALVDYVYTVGDTVNIYKDNLLVNSIQTKADNLFPILDKIYIIHDGVVTKMNMKGEKLMVFSAVDNLIGIHVVSKYVITWSYNKLYIFDEEKDEVKSTVTSIGPSSYNLKYNGTEFITNSAENDFAYTFIGNAIIHMGQIVYTHDSIIKRLYRGQNFCVVNDANVLTIIDTGIQKQTEGYFVFSKDFYYEVTQDKITQYSKETLISTVEIRAEKVLADGDFLYVLARQKLYVYLAGKITSFVDLPEDTLIAVNKGKLFFAKGKVLYTSTSSWEMNIKGSITNINIDDYYLTISTSSNYNIAMLASNYNDPKIMGLYTNNGLFPVDVSEVKVIQELRGSTGAKLVVDRLGRKFVMKTTENIDHLIEECTANIVYRNLGINVPEEHLYWKDGILTRLSVFYESIPFTGRGHQTTLLQKGFVVDAFLANWDVLGEDLDNVIITNGHILRIDNGGSLRYRAQGLKKDLTGVVNEFATMRCRALSIELNKNCKFFEDVSLTEIKRQIDLYLDPLKSIVSSIAGYIDAELYSILLARLYFLETFNEEHFYISQYIIGRYITKDRMLTNIPSISMESIIPQDEEYYLYRGMSSLEIGDMRLWYNEEIGLPVLKVGSSFKLRSKLVTSWSTNPLISEEFANKKYSMIMHVIVGKNDVLADLRIMNPRETEVILKPLTFNVKVLYIKLNGLNVPDTTYWDREAISNAIDGTRVILPRESEIYWPENVSPNEDWWKYE